MCNVFFYCPTHAREIESGIDLDENTFRRTRLNLVHVHCPWCGRRHRFLMADGRLGAEPEVQQSAAARANWKSAPIAAR